MYIKIAAEMSRTCSYEYTFIFHDLRLPCCNFSWVLSSPPRPPPSSQLQLMQGTQILKHFILNLVQDLYLGICEAKASILNY